MHIFYSFNMQVITYSWINAKPIKHQLKRKSDYIHTDICTLVKSPHKIFILDQCNHRRKSQFEESKQRRNNYKRKSIHKNSWWFSLHWWTEYTVRSLFSMAYWSVSQKLLGVSKSMIPHSKALFFCIYLIQRS